MNARNTISNNINISEYKNLNFVCPEDYEKCEHYNPKQPEESKCFKDSNIGVCVKGYFDYYDKATEVITEHGDIR